MHQTKKKKTKHTKDKSKNIILDFEGMIMQILIKNLGLSHSRSKKTRENIFILDPMTTLMNILFFFELFLRLQVGEQLRYYVTVKK